MKVMILTSYYTGYGHASITSSIEDVFKTRQIDYKIVESFDMCSKLFLTIGKSYGSVTRKRPKFWGFTFNFTHKHYKFINDNYRNSLKRKFLKMYNEYRPDVVVSVHPVFVGNIADIIEKYELNCKFITLLADLVTISNMWIDTRSDLIICPTTESYAFALRRGADIDKLRIVNLPTRTKITESAKRITSVTAEVNPETKFFMMSGGEGSGDMAGTIEQILKIDNSLITVIAGRNIKLEKTLKEKYKDNPRVTVYGFVNNINELMPRHDIAVVRGSPNVLMECINLLLPMVVTETLPGQEVGNIDFLINRGLGLYCNNKSKLINIINRYLENNKKLLLETKQKQFEYRDLAAAEKVADCITEAVVNF